MSLKKVGGYVGVFLLGVIGFGLGARINEGSAAPSMRSPGFYCIKLAESAHIQNGTMLTDQVMGRLFATALDTKPGDVYTPNRIWAAANAVVHCIVEEPQ